MVNWTSEEGSAGKGLGAGEGRQGEAKVEKMVEAKVPAKCQRSGSQKKKIHHCHHPTSASTSEPLNYPYFRTDAVSTIPLLLLKPSTRSV